MNLNDLLSEKKSFILQKWFDAIIENYPEDSSHFLKKQKDRFLNPVGNTIFGNIEGLFHAILRDAEAEQIYPFLDDIIKIHAVQNFSPSKAVSFMSLLKAVVRDALGKDITRHALSAELLTFEAQIDKLTFLSFDIYMKCRERIFELRVNEIKTMTFRLLKRANLISEVEEHESEINAETVLTQNIKG
jgi:RsbT co-antagonist protein rsbRD N-terminal domain